ncbi:hypothetical protein PV327_002480 [Microctonus hyperodae]|uniref:Small ribosomal subunit protein mS29 n=1 Tax=Microctonus hyperodae TaxID=165561 RepID=A0AA39FFZ3_MICHY|nr:hypothetical protein PV327_002480 [Microctonus hyperodae]
MALTFRCLLRGLSRPVIRNNSTIAEAIQAPDEQFQTFRTIENNPINHTNDHINRFYTMPSAVTERLFRYGGLPKRYDAQVKTFLENAILVREPAIEIISYLRLADYTKPANRYVLYGELGGGKSITLMHILHYGLESKRIIVHIPWVRDWFRRAKEVTPSQSKEGFYDIPVDAAAWLIHFKHQNAPLLSELDLKLSKDYIWNSREQNSAGSSLLKLLDFGMARPKYACDIIDALANELKMASIAGKCSTLVVIDGFNSFFGNDTKIKGTDFKYLTPRQVTVTQPFMNLTKYDWCNAAIVVTVDEFAVYSENHQSVLPRYLLGKEGFEHLDPFLPVEVPRYSQDEFETVMEYYKERKWVRNISKEGQRELELLSNRNPYKLMRYTASL